MKRLVFSILLGLAALSAAHAQSEFYINNGIVSTVYPPTPAPVIDAITFINRGYFAITNIVPGGFFGPPLPFETQNTLHYTNYNLMLGESGFRFDFYDANAARRKPAASFANGTSVADTNATIFGSIYLTVDSTNILNRGTLSIGGPGLMKLDGDNIDLARSHLTSFGTGQVDRYWGFSTNILTAIFNPSFIQSSFMLVETILGQFYFNVFQQLVLDQGYTAHILVTPVNATFQYVDAVFLANTNPLISTEVRFNPANGLRVIEWSSILTNLATGTKYTNHLYLEDNFDIVDAYRFANPPLNPIIPTPNPVQNYVLFSAQTFRPVNYNVTFAYPFFTNLTLAPPVQLDPTLFQGTVFPFVTNTGYAADIRAAPYIPDPYIAGSTYSNVPGRIEINAKKVLDLTRVRVNGQSFLSVKSTNHFVGSSQAEIISPYSDFDLATTNKSLMISNVITPFVPRMNGTIECWTGRWTNSSLAGVTSFYTVTIVDSQLDAEFASQIQNLKLRTPDIVISDVLNVFNSMLIDAENLTIVSNAPGSPTLTGAINLTSGEFTWSASLPRLQNLTNSGAITSVNSLYFGGARRPPFYAGSYDEPYQSFVNHGLIASQGNDTWARYYVSSGSNNSGVGPLTVRADQAYITNGAFVSPGGDITITAGSLLVSNQVLQAARSIVLNPSLYLDDGSLSQRVALITNKNFWVANNGIRLLSLPTQGSLLGTTLTNLAFPNANVVNYWAGADRGCTAAGFANNAALGRLILDAGTNGLFTFSSINGANALYVDYLELRGYANVRDINGDFEAIRIDPGMKVYFAHAVAEDGTIVSEKLDGRNGGGLCWVSDFHTGFFSSTNIFYGSTGTTNSINISLALSCDLDSDNDGVVNCLDAEPVPPSQLPIAGTGGSNTNNPGSSTNDVPVVLAQLAYPGNNGPIGTAYQSLYDVRGTYRGLFYDTNNVNAASSGYFILTSSGSAYSGRILTGGRSYLFSGRFDASGHAVRTIPRSGAPIILDLQLDRAGGNRLIGTVKSGDWTANLRADRTGYNSRTRPFPYKGIYTMVLPPDNSSANCPDGFGFGALSVNTAGNVVWVTTLADTLKVTQQTAVNGRGIFPLYAAPAGGRALLIGWVEIDPNELGGNTVWTRPSLPAKYYPAGFTNQTELVGTRYNVPPDGTRVVPLSNGFGQLIFAGDCLSAPFTNHIYLNSYNRLTSSDAQLTLGVNRLTGWFWGSALHPDTGKPLPFQGRFLQDANFGAGFSWTTNRSGSVYLAPVP